MVRRSSPWAIVSCATVVLSLWGCSNDEAAGGGSEPSLQELAKRQVELMDEWVTLIEGVSDERTAAAAKRGRADDRGLAERVGREVFISGGGSRAATDRFDGRCGGDRDGVAGVVLLLTAK